MRRVALLFALIAAPVAALASYPVLTGKVQVRDPQTLVINGTALRLAYVLGAPGPMTARLQAAIDARGGVATCYPFPDGRYACSLPAGEDIATLAVMYGFALASADAPQPLKDAQREAAVEGYGGWSHVAGAATAAPVPTPPVVQYPVTPQALTPYYVVPMPPPDDAYYADQTLPDVIYGGLPVDAGGYAQGWGYNGNGGYWGNGRYRGNGRYGRAATPVAVGHYATWRRYGAAIHFVARATHAGGHFGR